MKLLKINIKTKLKNLEILKGVKRRFQHHEAAVEKYRRRHVRNSCHKESEIEKERESARARASQKITELPRVRARCVICVNQFVFCFLFVKSQSCPVCVRSLPHMYNHVCVIVLCVIAHMPTHT